VDESIAPEIYGRDGQPSKASAPVGVTSIVQNYMPVICDSDAYDQ
jgi:hypothetical protein